MSGSLSAADAWRRFRLACADAGYVTVTSIQAQPALAQVAAILLRQRDQEALRTMTYGSDADEDAKPASSPRLTHGQG